MRQTTVGIYLTLLTLALFFITGCSSNPPKSLVDPLSLEDFFSGDLTAHGVVKNRSGEVTRRFNATIEASWSSGIGRLDEYFVFNDGEQQQRIWRLAPSPNGDWSATANDTLGIGVGELNGATFRLKYKLLIDYRGRKLALDVDDRMWQVSQNVIINQSVLRKYGFRLGSIQLAIVKKSIPPLKHDQPAISSLAP